MNIGGWCANITTNAMKVTCTNAILLEHLGCGVSSLLRCVNWCLKSRVTPAAFIRTANAAFQPKVESMNMVSHSHLPATIKTGGAAKGVNVPPMEIFTNKTPTVAYFSCTGISLQKSVERSNSAASVMAAGSVMNDPAKGTSVRIKKYRAIFGVRGMNLTMAHTVASANCKIGRVPAITMMTNTNIGSVKFRVLM
ncbi:hypothetical protein LINBF2_08960 [Limnohabitans sp. INBF002]|nr:hypothetical protein LINBF2_08960 [Limnohabitans sp. INBF002]